VEHAGAILAESDILPEHLLGFTDSQSGVGERAEDGLLDPSGCSNQFFDLFRGEAGLRLGLGFRQFGVDQAVFLEPTFGMTPFENLLADRQGRINRSSAGIPASPAIRDSGKTLRVQIAGPK